MTLRILIVDDEQLAIDRLTEFCRDIDGVEVVGSARDGASAAQTIADLRPDLVMLDIQMPGESGMALAASLPPDKRPEIIFVTAFEQYAPDAFAVEATDYLLKPVRLDRLRQAINRAERRRLQKSASDSTASPSAQTPYRDAIWIPVKAQMVRLAIENIEWIEAAKDYVLLHTATRSYIHRISMTALEEILDPDALTRVHRSSFVRLSLVEKIDRPGKGLVALQLKDGAVISVGPNYTKDVLARLGLSA